MGNIWVFILGGYHTSANTLHFIFILLAIHPEIQRELQKSLDEHFGDRPPASWTLERDFPALLDGCLGAVVAETARIFGVLPFIPKSTGTTPQLLTLDGRSYTIPPDTLILINNSATHRNPKYWPETIRKSSETAPFPVSNWDPWRWLKDGNRQGLLKPEPGSYIPFSEGARQCIGKRFAQVELCAILSQVLKRGSIQLAVEGGVFEEGNFMWIQARDNAVKELSEGVGFRMALELFGKVELSFVLRD
jgi:cytochrome P450